MNNTLKKQGKFVIFILRNSRYALPLDSVQKVIHAVQITSLPKAPDIVSGIINVRGTIIPVYNVRKRFGLPEKALALNDQIIIAETSARTVCFPVDNVEGILDSSQLNIIMPGEILPEMEYVKGVIKLNNGIVFIHDLDQFLSLQEESALKEALDKKDEK